MLERRWALCLLLASDMEQVRGIELNVIHTWKCLFLSFQYRLNGTVILFVFFLVRKINVVKELWCWGTSSLQQWAWVECFLCSATINHVLHNSVLSVRVKWGCQVPAEGPPEPMQPAAVALQSASHFTPSSLCFPRNEGSCQLRGKGTSAWKKNVSMTFPGAPCRSVSQVPRPQIYRSWKSPRAVPTSRCTKDSAEVFRLGSRNYSILMLSQLYSWRSAEAL